MGQPRLTLFVFEVCNLRQGDKTRPGDVIWLNFLGPGQHLLIDVSITGVYRDAVLKDVCRIPGFAAKAVEDAKLDEDFRSSSPVSQCHGGRHRLVPFVLEEGGRFIGDHALLLWPYILSEIADIGAETGKLKALESCTPAGPAPIPRQPRLIGFAGGSRRSRVGCRSPCLAHFFARHLVPLCIWVLD